MSYILHILQTYSARNGARLSAVFLMLAVGLMGVIHAADKPSAKSSTNRAAQKQAAAKIDAEDNAALVKSLQEIVESCQSRATLAKLAAEMTFSSKYDLELSKRQLEKSETRRRLDEVDYAEARIAAAEAANEAQKDLLAQHEQCKQKARTAMDEKAKSLAAIYSSGGLEKEIQAFLVAWYSALEATGTDRFKAQQNQFETTSENLKLVVCLGRNLSQRTISIFTQDICSYV